MNNLNPNVSIRTVEHKVYQNMDASFSCERLRDIVCWAVDHAPEYLDPLTDELDLTALGEAILEEFDLLADDPYGNPEWVWEIPPLLCT